MYTLQQTWHMRHSFGSVGTDGVGWDREALFPEVLELAGKSLGWVDSDS